MNYILLISGFILLFIGGEMLVRGSVEISKRLGISTILIGMIVVGFGTSTPELLVSVQASLIGQSDIALGNIVGSNIANVLLILGISAVISPIICNDKVISRDSFTVMITSILLTGLTNFSVISRIEGFFMLTSLILYLFYSYKAEQKQKSATILSHFVNTPHEEEAKEFESKKTNLITSVLLVIIGIIILICGANFLIKGAVNLARQIGVSEAIIGLSLIAVGTSLPELATSIIASIKKNSDIVIGNILGSNLFNILGILGLTAIVKPIQINNKVADFDIPFNMGISIGSVLIIFLIKKFDRTVGIISLIVYIAYITYLYLNGNIA